MFRKLILLLLPTLTLTACDPALDREFRIQGAGADLYNTFTDSHTQNLEAYFKAICRQAGYPKDTQNCPPGPTNVNKAAEWSLLVETGYNDIDARCDRYLTWITSKRSERILVDGIGTAAATLTAGVLNAASAGAAAITYTALALGFSEAAYDSYQSGILLGLEDSTILEIVKKRRLEHRVEFRGSNYSTRPQAVFALKLYLSYCTPQSILTDANVLSRDAVNNRPATLTQDAQRAAGVLPEAPTSVSSAERPDDSSNPDAVPTLDDYATIPGFGERQLSTLQTGACVRGNADKKNRTLTAIRIIEETLKRQGQGGAVTQNGKLDEAEWDIVAEPLRRSCPAQLKNYWEVGAFGGDGGRNFVNTLVVKKKLPDTLRDRDLGDSDVRAELAKLRASVAVAGEIDAKSDIDDQITPAFNAALDNL